MTLSPFERLLLINQLRILEKLYPDEAEDLAIRRMAVANGWELEIEDFLPRGGLNKEECIEVIDILDMFSMIKRSYDELAEREGIDDWEVTFQGFDGNNEFEQLAYTRYLIEDQGKFVWLKRGPVAEYNSHMPTLWRYRSMLRHWKNTGRKYDLSGEELQALLAAGRASS